MGQTSLLIEDFEDKKTKAGKIYTSFVTNEGRINCFDAVLAKDLKAMCGGKAVVAEIQEKDGFKNIKSALPAEMVSDAPALKPRVDLEANKQAGVAMRYAVDLCIAGKIELKDIDSSAQSLLDSMRKLSIF